MPVKNHCCSSTECSTLIPRERAISQRACVASLEATGIYLIKVFYTLYKTMLFIVFFFVPVCLFSSPVLTVQLHCDILQSLQAERMSDCFLLKAKLYASLQTAPESLLSKIRPVFFSPTFSPLILLSNGNKAISNQLQNLDFNWEYKALPLCSGLLLEYLRLQAAECFQILQCKKNNDLLFLFLLTEVSTEWFL